MAAKTTTKVAKVATVTVQEKFAIMRREMAEALVEREGEIDVVLTALVCGEHPLLVGPPGTAKSLLLNSVMRWMGTGVQRFAMLLNKYSTPEEVFGPISVVGLKSDVYRRVTTSRLPEAHVAFIDEIFKASTAILNTMLEILNERTYENGDGSKRKCPLRIAVAASNEWPSDENGGKELGALFDRFLFRKTVRPVSRASRDKLLWNRNHNATLTTTISEEELEEAKNDAKAMDWTDEAKEVLGKILDELNEEGIFPGDRRMYKSVEAAQAYAYLCGSDEVKPEHLEILQYVLWVDPTEQPEKAARIITKLANPTGWAITDKLIKAEEVVTKDRPSEAVPKLQEIQKELQALPDHVRKAAAIRTVGGHIKRLYDRVIGL